MLSARQTVLIVLGLLPTLRPEGAAAQEALTLDRAVQTALSQNASLRAAGAATAEADAQRAGSRSAFFPRVSFVESWRRGDQPVFVFSSLLSARRFAAENFALDALNHPDPIGFFHTSVSIEQVVFDAGRRAAVDAAALQRDLAGATRDHVAAGVALAATETFGRILKADSSGRAVDAGLAAAREDLARAERRRDAGMATNADVLALVLHVTDLQQRSIQARGDAAVARAELNRLMGVPVDRDVPIAEPLAPDRERVGVADTDVAALFAEADAVRPDLRRAVIAQRLAEAAQRQARAGVVPQLAAQAAFDVSGTRFNDRASGWLVGGELRWTFSTGGAELARMKAALHAAARARADADEARGAVHVDVLSALRKLEGARAREAVGRAAVDQARESQRIIRDRFEAGMAPINDVLRASTAVLDAEANRIAALVDVIVGNATLRRALGRTP